VSTTNPGDVDHSVIANFGEFARDTMNGVAKFIVRAAMVVAMIGCGIGFLDFVLTLGTAPSAPQLAAGAASAMAWAVIPYCFARLLKDLLTL
jgi:hypothetical protein